MLHCGQERIRHNSLRSTFGTYSVSLLTFVTHSARGAYHFSAGKLFFRKTRLLYAMTAGSTHYAPLPQHAVAPSGTHTNP